MQYNVHDCTLFNKLTIIWCFYYALLIQLDNELDLMQKKHFCRKTWAWIKCFQFIYDTRVKWDTQQPIGNNNF